MEKRKTAPNVDAYLAQFSGKQKAVLERVRRAIRAAAPEAEEVISYQIPMYRLQGPVAGFAGFKNHCSFFPTSYAIMAAFQEELKPFDVSKGTIRFSPDRPLPLTLIRKLVLAKIQENRERTNRKLAKGLKPG